VAGLLSENAAARAAAEQARAAQLTATARLAEKLASATGAAQRANDHALASARDREALADFAGKLQLALLALVGLAALGAALSVAARLFPGVGVLGTASHLLGGVLAPGLAYAAHRASTGLARVGQGLAKVRTLVPDAESLIERAFDPVTDTDHQRAIASGAKTAR
jgi:hypothetical protein